MNRKMCSPQLSEDKVLTESQRKKNDTVLIRIENEVLVNTYPDLASIEDSSWIRAIRSAQQIRVPQGTSLLRGYAQMQQFMLLLQGTVRVFYPSKCGREITLYRVHPGDLCILSLNSLYQNKDYGVCAETDTDIYALGISAQDFQLVIRESEKFRDFVLSTLNGRLCELMCLVQDTVFENLDVRLACLIGKLIRKQNSILIKITHQALAYDLGTTREMVSRILKDFEQQELIKLSRGHIEVLSVEGLGNLQQEKIL